MTHMESYDKKIFPLYKKRNLLYPKCIICKISHKKIIHPGCTKINRNILMIGKTKRTLIKIIFGYVEKNMLNKLTSQTIHKLTIKDFHRLLLDCSSSNILRQLNDFVVIENQVYSPTNNIIFTFNGETFISSLLNFDNFLLFDYEMSDINLFKEEIRRIYFLWIQNNVKNIKDNDFTHFDNIANKINNWCCEHEEDCELSDTSEEN